MRTAFIETLFELAQRNDRIMLLTGDLGFGVVTRFMQALPQQFVNAGVAEQRLTGLVAGVALSVNIVFSYSIAGFPLLRCYEQIRNDVCYHRANVKIVSIGAGMAYGSVGVTHHATEDLAVMRALPNMLVVAPNDTVEAAHATRAVAAHDGPCYLRLGRFGEPTIHAPDVAFQLGKAITVREGQDLTLVVAGGLLKNALLAAESLAQRGLQARVLSMHTVKPLDVEAVLAAARETPAIFTLEEHTVMGGLGSAVAEVLLESGCRPRYFKRIGLQDTFTSTVGGQEYLRSVYGLDVPSILRAVEATREFEPSSLWARMNTEKHG